MEINSQVLLSLRLACRQLGEDRVTVATSTGVVTFQFHDDGSTTGRALQFESQPDPQELSAMFGIYVPTPA